MTRDEWIREFVRYLDGHTDRGSGRYAQLVAGQQWQQRGNMTGEQAAMRWIFEHAPKDHAASRRRRSRKAG